MLSEYSGDFKNLIEEFKQDYPEIPESKIEILLENRLIDLFKDYIQLMEIPENITIKDLKLLRGKIRLMQKSGRYERKIDSIIRNFNRKRQFLKFKGIQDSLNTWEKFSENNNLNFLTEGSSLLFNNETFFDSNGNKDPDTTISQRIFRKNQNQFEYKGELINNGDNKILEPEFDTAFEFSEDSIAEFEKMDLIKQKEDEEDKKIPIEFDLLNRIKNIKSEPMKKKESKNLSILALNEELNELNDE